MLFNSYEFILLFLPITAIVYFLLNYIRLPLVGKFWLIVTSLLFYSFWNIKYLPLILFSIGFNYLTGRVLQSNHLQKKKFFLFFGIFINLLVLGYYKYADFFISNLNALTTSNLPLLEVILPLGISFFTFTQIAFLVDTYKGLAKEYSLLNYSLFVTFFPHLLAGPIIHHKEMMPQFASLRTKVLRWRNVSIGVFLLSIGLFKKVVIADSFAIWANLGFNNSAELTFLSGWATSLSYTFQIYFDFSGYTDMALGAAFIFNIVLPPNFNSPYKALNIQDFWQRWHITLSRFLRDYIYIPLGGSRVAKPLILFNLFITFLIGGLWHGAGWTFIIWGLLHGIAIILHRIWQWQELKMSKPLAWFLTFNFINITWIFFKAQNLEEAKNLLRSIFGFNGVVIPKKFSGIFEPHFGNVLEFGRPFSILEARPNIFIFIFLAFIFILCFNNSNQLAGKLTPSLKTLLFILFLFFSSLLFMSRVSEFLYFNF